MEKVTYTQPENRLSVRSAKDRPDWYQTPFQRTGIILYFYSFEWREK